MISATSIWLLLQIPMLTLVPPIAVMLSKMELDESIDLSCIESLVCGSGGPPLHPRVFQTLSEKFGKKIYMRECEYI